MVRTVTGWCSSGSHEGTPAVSQSGKTFPDCQWPDMCACDCHVKLKKMREMAGIPEPVREPPSAVPDPAKLAALGIVSRAMCVSDGGPIEDAPKTREFKPTPSGRRSKGQLEYDVWDVCLDWIANPRDVEFLTPAVVAQLVNPNTPPSSGAVDAVFRRWASLKVALVAPKPTRFVGFMPGVVDMGLDQFKAMMKRRASRQS